MSFVSEAELLLIFYEIMVEYYNTFFWGCYIQGCTSNCSTELILKFILIYVFVFFIIFLKEAVNKDTTKYPIMNILHIDFTG